MSALYTGLVQHVRLGPRRHGLRYRLFMLLIDLDSVGRFGVEARDHLDGSGAPLRPQVEALIRAEGRAVPDGSVRLLTMPRVLGRVFNPLSLFYCYDAGGVLRVVVYEVNNTFGGRHTYVLPVERQRCEKAFFVSPFMEQALTYVFAVEAPAETVSVGIRVGSNDRTILTASFVGARRPLTVSSLVRAWITHPLQLIGVLAGIYFEAAKMLAKGFQWRSPAARQVAAKASEPCNETAMRSPQGPSTTAA